MSQNRHRFQKFSEKLEAVSVDVAHRVQDVQITPDDGMESSFFFQEINKWRTLNCTAHFAAFLAEAWPFVQSMAMIVYHQEKIVTILLKHLRVEGSTAMEPLLILLHTLARDCRHEFYPFFPQALDTLIQVLNPKDPHLLEQIFTTLSYLFKYLIKQIVTDLPRVFSLYLSLLEHRKEFVRKFAGEAFSSLLRKLKAKQLSDAVNTLMGYLETQKNTFTLVDGLSALFFAAMKGVQTQFFSRMPELLNILLLSTRATLLPVAVQELRVKTVSKTLDRMRLHTRAQHSKPVLDAMVSEFQWALKNWKQAASIVNSNNELENATMLLNRHIDLLSNWITFKFSQKVPKDMFSKFVALLQELFSTDVVLSVSCPLSLKEASLHLVANIWRNMHFAVSDASKNKTLPISLFDSIFQVSDQSLVIDFIGSLIREPAVKDFSESWLSRIISFCSSSAAHVDILSTARIALLIVDVISTVKTVDPHRLSSLFTARQRFRVPELSGHLFSVLNRFVVDSNTKTSKTPKKQQARKEQKDEPTAELTFDSEVNCSSLWAVLHCIGQIDVDEKEAVQTVEKLLSSIERYMTSSSFAASSASSSANQNIVCLYATCSSVLTSLRVIHDPDALNRAVPTVMDMLKRFPQNVSVLSATASFVQLTKSSSKSNQLTSELLESIYVDVLSNLSHHSYEIRTETLKILTGFEPLRFIESGTKDSQESIFHGPCDVLNEFLEMELLPNDVQTEREKQMKLRKVQNIVETGRVPIPCLNMIIHACLGSFHVKLATLWPVAQAVLGVIAEKYSETFWNVFFPLLEQKDKETSLSGPLSNVAVADNNEEQDDVEDESDDKVMTDSTEVTQVSVQDKMEVIRRFETAQVCLVPHTDVVTFLNSLFTTLSKASGIAEKKSKQIIPFFFNFLHNEYNVVFQEGDVDEASTNESIDFSDENIRRYTAHRKITNKKLSGFLRLFAQYKNAKTQHRADDLLKQYFRFLMKSDSSIQKLALDCLLTWKLPYVVPYKENLERFISDSTFKEEMTMFAIHPEAGQLKEEHRRELIPVLARILFPKLLIRRGKVAKETLSGRRAAVFSFFSGFRPDELEPLIELLVEPFHIRFNQIRELGDASVQELVHSRLRISSTTKQLGFLNTFGELLHQLGTLLLPYLEPLSLFVYELIHFSLTDKSPAVEANKKAVELKREVYRVGLKQLANLFDKFPGLDFASLTANLVTVLDQSNVLEKIPTEMTQSSSALVEWFVVWTKHEQLQPLLGRFPKVLKSLFALLSAKNVHSKVVHLVLMVLENLIEPPWLRENKKWTYVKLDRKKRVTKDADESSDDEEEAEATRQRAAEMEKEEKAKKVLNPILQPHVGELLVHFHVWMSRPVNQTVSESDKKALLRKQALSKNKDVRKKVALRVNAKTTFGRRELSILSRLAVYASNSEVADRLCVLLFPFLKSKQTPEPMKLHILNIFTSLLPLLSSVSDYLNGLSSLFFELRDMKSRSALAAVFLAVTQKDAEFMDVAPLLVKLNAIAVGRVDEFDYDLRMEAASQFNETYYRIWNSRQLTPVLYHYLFALQDEELGIRNSVVHGLSRFVNHLASLVTELSRQLQESTDLPVPQDISSFVQLLARQLMPAIRKGIKLQNEMKRKGFIEVLGGIVRHFSKAAGKVPAFSHYNFHVDLRCLLHSDPEADFFENIIHLQMYRRIRALQRLRTNISEQKLSASSLVHIALPLTNHFLYENRSRDGGHNVLEEAVNGLGQIAHELEWNHYYSLIQTLIRQLGKRYDLQKMLIKALCTVVENFHFAVPDALDAIAAESDEQVQKAVQEGSQIAKLEHQIVTDTPAESTVAESPVDSAVNTSKAKGKNGRKHNGSTADEDVENDEEDESNQDAVQVDDEDETMEKDGEIEEEEEEEEDDEQVQELDRMDVDNTAASAESDQQRIEREEELRQKIQKAIGTKVVPALRRLLVYKEDEKELVRMPVATALVLVMRKLPVRIFHLELPKIIATLCDNLKSRDQEARNTSRETLIFIIKTVGYRYLYYILDEMKTALTRGYQVHVFSFTTHALLSALLPTLTPGSIDRCLDLIVPLLMDELTGNLAEEKEVDALKKAVREAKSVKSFDTFEILARVVDFEKEIGSLLIPVRDAIKSTESLKVANKLEEALRRISNGLLDNPTVHIEALCVLSYKFTRQALGLDDDTDADSANQKAAKTLKKKLISAREQTMLVQPGAASGKAVYSILKSKKRTGFKSLYATAIGTFALRLMHSALKKRMIDYANEDHMSKMDPWVELLNICLKSKADSVLIWALKVFHILLRWPLPTLKTSVPHMVQRIFKIIEYSGSSKTELIQASFKSLSSIIRHCEYFSFTDPQLKVILNLISADLENPEKQNTSFACLKAIISRKFVTSEVYDMMNRVGELLIRGHTPQIRQLCSQVYIQFLLDYPLSEKRLQQHIDHLIRNLTYPDEGGRGSILDTLIAIINKFPVEVLDEQAEFMFLPLVVCLVNDESVHVVKSVSNVIKQLMGRVGQDRQQSMIQLMNKWFSNPNAVMKRAAAQVTGLTVEVAGTAFQKYLKESVDIFETVLTSATNESSDWEICYYVLLSLENMFKVLPTPLEKQLYSHRAVWDGIVSLLIHENLRVRFMASRVLGSYISRRNPADTNQISSDSLLAEPSGFLFHQIAKNLIESFKEPKLDDELGDQIVRDLLFVCVALSKNPSLSGRTEDDLRMEEPVDELADSTQGTDTLPEAAQEENEEDDEEDEEEEINSMASAVGVEGKVNGKRRRGEEKKQNTTGSTSKDGAAAETGENNDKTKKKKNKKKRKADNLPGRDAETDQLVSMSGLKWIFTRLSHMARTLLGESIGVVEKRLSHIFRFFAAASMQLDVPLVSNLLVSMVSPLYRVVNLKQLEDKPVAGLAQEVLDLIQRRVGPTIFLAAYSHVREAVTVLRNQRKMAERVEAVANPQKAAKRKLSRAVHKKESKKRKVEEIMRVKKGGRAPDRAGKLESRSAIPSDMN